MLQQNFANYIFMFRIQIVMIYIKTLLWVEFEFNRFKKVLESVGQSEHHNIT